MVIATHFYATLHKNLLPVDDSFCVNPLISSLKLPSFITDLPLGIHRTKLCHHLNAYEIQYFNLLHIEQPLCDNKYYCEPLVDHHCQNFGHQSFKLLCFLSTNHCRG
ncbi:hypothetical protein QTP88_025891 [Uroleucon formosanum]